MPNVDAGNVVIVGGGHGGAQAAIALRKAGFEGDILIIGAEPELPYDRPPLSKEYLARVKPFERIVMRPAAFWEEKRVEMRLGVAVTGIDAEAKQLQLADGGRVTYQTLIWSAGGNPIRLACEGGELRGIHSVRNKSDVDAIMAQLDGGARKVVIVGGGYIGLEAAAALTKLGCSVTVLEAQDRVLARVAGEELSRFFEEEHRAHGVDMRLGAALDSFLGEDGRLVAARLKDGETIACDMVIVGIGIRPCIEALVDAGAKSSNGVEVDEFCRTSLADIYAIGDCAAHANPFAENAVIRLESVQNANDMANLVAKSICGTAEPYGNTPWFWSNQYDLKLQTVGLSSGHEEAIIRGDPAERKFSVIYLRDKRVIALDCINSVKDYVQGRKLVEGAVQVDPEEISDIARPLKEFWPIS